MKRDRLACDDSIGWHISGVYATHGGCWLGASIKRQTLCLAAVLPCGVNQLFAFVRDDPMFELIEVATGRQRL